jgi:hypothetical protein
MVIVPPSITVQPSNLTADQGSSATFSVTVTGTDPLFYQWYFNGTNLLAGATSTSLTLNNVQVTDTGNYSVVVTNVAGSVTSLAAALALTCDASPSGLVAWWPGNGDAYDVVGNNNGTLQGGTSFTNGIAGQAFYFNGTDAYVEIADS